MNLYIIRRIVWLDWTIVRSIAIYKIRWQKPNKFGRWRTNHNFLPLNWNSIPRRKSAREISLFRSSEQQYFKEPANPSKLQHCKRASDNCTRRHAFVLVVILKVSKRFMVTVSDLIRETISQRYLPEVPRGIAAPITYEGLMEGRMNETTSTLAGSRVSLYLWHNRGLLWRESNIFTILATLCFTGFIARDKIP